MHGRTQLAESLDSSDITIVPGVYDGISARLIEEVGFDTGFLSGAGVSNSRLAQPDMGVLNLTEIASLIVIKTNLYRSNTSKCSVR